MSHHKKRPGKCIFCEGGNLSKEHFWPEWASTLLPNYPINQHVEHLLTFTEVTKLKEPPKVRTRNGHAWTKKIRVVCASCNNGWMSALEAAAKPILTPLITGTCCTLTAASAQVLAQWIALKIMVGEQNQADAITPLEDRKRFKSTLEIPPNFRIWIAKCGGGGWQTGYRRHAATVSLTPTPPPIPGKNIQSVTFGIGDLLVHVLYTTVPDLQLDLGLGQHQAVISLSPFMANINWPPARTLSINEAGFLAQTLDRLLQGNQVRWMPLPA